MLSDALQRPLEDLLEGFLTDLDLQNRSGHYIQVVGSHARRTFAGCGWKHIADVDAGSFLEFRATLRTRKGEVLSARAQNDWLDSLTAFFNWLVSPRKVIKENPLAHIGKVSTRSAKKIKRRGLSFEQFDKLLQVAGRNRAVYHFAGRTGLRRGEIKQVRVYDLHLDESKPYVAVRGSTTKNGKDAWRDLSPELVVDLKATIPVGAGAEELVFKRVPLVPELCLDLKKAGIPFLDDLGRRLDSPLVSLELVGACPDCRGLLEYRHLPVWEWRRRKWTSSNWRIHRRGTYSSFFFFFCNRAIIFSYSFGSPLFVGRLHSSLCVTVA